MDKSDGVVFTGTMDEFAHVWAATEVRTSWLVISDGFGKMDRRPGVGGWWLDTTVIIGSFGAFSPDTDLCFLSEIK